jgi:predicted ATPase
MMLQGRVGEARAEARSANRTRAEQGKGLHQPYGLVESAAGLAQAGQLERAMAAVERAVNLIQQTSERFWEAETYRLRGEILMLQANATSDALVRKQAEESFRTALDIAQQQNARTLELRAAVSLARLLNLTGRPEEARQSLEQCYRLFSEGFDTPELHAARELLDQADVGSRQPQNLL